MHGFTRLKALASFMVQPPSGYPPPVPEPPAQHRWWDFASSAKLLCWKHQTWNIRTVMPLLKSGRDVRKRCMQLLKVHWEQSRAALGLSLGPSPAARTAGGKLEEGRLAQQPSALSIPKDRFSGHYLHSHMCKHTCLSDPGRICELPPEEQPSL